MDKSSSGEKFLVHKLDICCIGGGKKVYPLLQHCPILFPPSPWAFSWSCCPLGPEGASSLGNFLEKIIEGCEVLKI